MKLELKHLAGYLPYGVKFISEMDKPYDEYGHQPIWALNGISEMFGDYCLLTKQNSDAYDIVTCKPILRPLSDLTKEIEHNGEFFVPKKVLRKLSGAFEPDNDFKNPFSFHFVDNKLIGFSALCLHINQLELFNKLFEWHFDVFNLLENGLAIDINTL